MWIGEEMNNLDDNKLRETYGGENITGTLVSAFTDGIKVIFEVGRSLGFSIRRISGSNLCPIH